VKSAVIVFPGSNCDRDLAEALRLTTGAAPAMIWHRDSELPDGLDLIAVPGGFSYGDYLRSGAMAAQSPVMRAVKEAAERGVAVLGICNGFQVLTEARLLPGALMRNAGIAFIGRDVPLIVENSQSIFTAGYQAGEQVVIPVAHHDGNYQAETAVLDRLEGEGRVAFRYAGPVNGSARNIAGILNEAGNVLGMMPHPERAVEPAHGLADGRRLFEGLLAAVGAGTVA
jgi:phosphoribosylformylglycinamidine synthase I